ncbi:FxLD family lanthipeptide [Catenuloplanes japonicus]|uniref:FxLD family lanthipeptide n=1 Tax=Catenuloplanes japonicus TaxID=33876 RepID=UPI000A0FCEA1|nr:FxLD family lanthipeptide [Catenuloplanes japonicus]
MDLSTSSVVTAVVSGDTDDGFDLDVRIVEGGPGRLALLADTDDNCDTQKPGDC